MRFTQHRLFAYTDEALGGHSMKSIFGPAGVKIGDGLALSGLSDIATTLMILQEWYWRNHPAIDFREVRTDISEKPVVADTLWNEPAGLKKEFARVVSLAVKLVQDPKNFKREREGIQKSQPIKVFMDVLSLHERDYMPAPGDEFYYRGQPYEIYRVHTLPSDYFQNTGFPLHICAEAYIKHLDGTLMRSEDKGLTEGGKPSPLEPQTDGPDLTGRAPLDLPSAVPVSSLDLNLGDGPWEQ